MYIPLEFCQKMDVSLTKPHTTLGRILRLLTETPDDAIAFLHSDSQFLNPDYQGYYMAVNLFLQKERQKILKLLHLDTSTEEKKAKAFIRDFFMSFLFVEVWKWDKEVYQFDSELEFALSDIEHIEVPVRSLDRVPYRTFYLEFSKDGIYSSHFHGAFIHLIKEKQGYKLYIMRLTEDGKSMFGNGSFIPDSNEENAVFIVDKGMDTACGTAEKDVDWPEFIMFLLNALLYLCSENAEIRENATTKQTYHPSAKVKNKFSEIRKYDCGFVYGSEVRKHREKAVKKESQEKASKNVTKTKSRTSMRPHTRKAHWHHYWTGKGRKELVLRWVAPTRVGTGERVATIHKIK